MLESNLVYSKEVVEFVTVANEYCIFLENCRKIEHQRMIKTAQSILPLLYLKSVLLPKIENCLEEANEKIVSETDWIFINEAVAEKLESKNNFIQVLDMINESQEELVNLSLSECFADIYQDLKNFIALYQVGNYEMMNDALWECQSNFEQFWGQRLLAILNELHYIKYKNEIE